MPPDHIEIQPESVRLSQDESPPSRRVSRALKNYTGIGLGLLIIVTGATFLLWEDREGRLTIGWLNSSSTQEFPDFNPSTRSASQDSTDNLPFEDLEMKRARSKASDVLREFGSYNDQIEREQLGLTIPKERERFDAIIDRMNAADERFAQADYIVALSEYEAATEELQIYSNELEDRFNVAITETEAAILARDELKAGATIQRALAIKPRDPIAITLEEQTAKLPELNRLLRESDRAVLRGEFEAGRSIARQAVELFPTKSEPKQRLREINDRLADLDYDAQLSRAYRRLGERQFSEAEKLFQQALIRRPADPGPQSGLAQIDSARREQEIASLKQQIATAEANLDVELAIELYDRVLSIESNLQFAREGKRRAEAILLSQTQLNQILQDPYRLSDQTTFELAGQVLELAEKHVGFSREFDKDVQALGELLEHVSQTVPFVVLSDNNMEIRISNVGFFDPFERKEWVVRPGRYVIHGSSFGCKDIRKTIIVSSEMDPVSVTCERPI